MALLQLRMGSDYYNSSPLLKEAMDAAAKEQGRDKKATFVRVLNSAAATKAMLDKKEAENKELKETIALFETDPETLDLANIARTERERARVKEENERLMERCRKLIREAKTNEDYIQKIERQLKEEKQAFKKCFDNLEIARKSIKDKTATLLNQSTRISELETLLQEGEESSTVLELNQLREERTVLKHVLSKFLA